MCDSISPESIDTESDVTCISSHSTLPLLAAGQVDGRITLFDFELNVGSPRRVFSQHKAACRCVSITDEGQLFSAGKKRSIAQIDIESGTLVNHWCDVHRSPLYSLLSIDRNFVASGDEDGVLKIWDLRRPKDAIAEFAENDGMISDMVMLSDRKILLAVSGDGTLSAFNLRRKRLEIQSELFDSELLSICLLKGESRAVVGSGEGALYVFHRDQWSNMADRILGHDLNVDCLLPFDDEVFISGCFDGKIRAVQLEPNQVNATLAECQLPIDGLCVSHDRRTLFSHGHESKIRIWTLDEDKLRYRGHQRKKDKYGKRKHVNTEENFFADLL